MEGLKFCLQTGTEERILYCTEAAYPGTRECTPESQPSQESMHAQPILMLSLGAKLFVLYAKGGGRKWYLPFTTASRVFPYETHSQINKHKRQGNNLGNAPREC